MNQSAAGMQQPAMLRYDPSIPPHGTIYGTTYGTTRDSTYNFINNRKEAGDVSRKTTYVH